MRNESKGFRKSYVELKEHFILFATRQQRRSERAQQDTVLCTFSLLKVCSSSHSYLDLEKEYAALVCRLVIGNLSL